MPTEEEKHFRKLRILYLKDILEEAETCLTGAELLAELENRGIKVERKTLYDDIKCLKEYGADIIKRSHLHGWRSNDFPQKKLEQKLDNLLNNNDPTVREAVAYQGYGLDRLAKDEDNLVRIAVAEVASKYGREDLLEKLVDDKYFLVREEVARQGYFLDELIKDKDERVRIAVLEGAIKTAREDLIKKLSNDKSSYVREHVADKGHELNKLVEDEDCTVRAAVARVTAKLKREDLLEKLSDNDDWCVLMEVVSQANKLGREDLLEKLTNSNNKSIAHYAKTTLREYQKKQKGTIK